MLKCRNVALRLGLGFVFLLAVGSAQQPSKSQPVKPQTNGSSAAHQEPNPVSGRGAVDITTKQEQDAAPGEVDRSQYVGAQACADCHENAGSSFAVNPHSKTLKNKRPDRQGCESCHGAGKAHAESGDPDNIVRFESVSKAGTAKICLECHQLAQEDGSSLHREHVKADVGCLDCHSVHSAKVQEHLLRSEKTKLCSSCHANPQR